MEIMLRKLVVSPETITDEQLFAGLHQRGLIGIEEALAAIGRGEMPAAIRLVVGAMPANVREATIIRLAGARTIQCSDPVIDGIRQLYGWTPDQRDEFLAFANTL